MSATLPRATLVQLTQAGDDEVLYVVVRSADAVGFLDEAVHRLDGWDAIALPWEVLPGLEAEARLTLASYPPGAMPPYITVGTVEDGQWITWYPTAEQPPVPEESA